MTTHKTIDFYNNDNDDKSCKHMSEIPKSTTMYFLSYHHYQMCYKNEERKKGSLNEFGFVHKIKGGKATHTDQLSRN